MEWIATALPTQGQNIAIQRQFSTSPHSQSSRHINRTVVKLCTHANDLKLQSTALRWILNSGWHVLKSCNRLRCRVWKWSLITKQIKRRTKFNTINLVALNFRLKFSPLWMIGLKHISIWSESMPARRYFLESRAASRLSAILECFTRWKER